MNMIKVNLPGAPELRFGDDVRLLRLRKAVAWLACLAASTCPHSCEELAALLWPEVKKTMQSEWIVLSGVLVDGPIATLGEDAIRTMFTVRGSPVSKSPVPVAAGHEGDQAAAIDDTPTTAHDLFAVEAFSTEGGYCQCYLGTGDVVVVEGIIDPATNQVTADLIVNTTFLALGKDGTWTVCRLDGQ